MLDIKQTRSSLSPEMLLQTSRGHTGVYKTHSDRVHSQPTHAQDADREERGARDARHESSGNGFAQILHNKKAAHSTSSAPQKASHGVSSPQHREPQREGSVDVDKHGAAPAVGRVQGKQVGRVKKASVKASPKHALEDDKQLVKTFVINLFSLLEKNISPSTKGNVHDDGNAVAAIRQGSPKLKQFMDALAVDLQKNLSAKQRAGMSSLQGIAQWLKNPANDKAVMAALSQFLSTEDMGVQGARVSALSRKIESALDKQHVTPAKLSSKSQDTAREIPRNAPPLRQRPAQAHDARQARGTAKLDPKLFGEKTRAQGQTLTPKQRRAADQLAHLQASKRVRHIAVTSSSQRSTTPSLSAHDEGVSTQDAGNSLQVKKDKTPVQNRPRDQHQAGALARGKAQTVTLQSANARAQGTATLQRVAPSTVMEQSRTDDVASRFAQTVDEKKDTTSQKEKQPGEANESTEEALSDLKPEQGVRVVRQQQAHSDGQNMGGRLMHQLLKEDGSAKKGETVVDKGNGAGDFLTSVIQKTSTQVAPKHAPVVPKGVHEVIHEAIDFYASSGMRENAQTLHMTVMTNDAKPVNVQLHTMDNGAIGVVLGASDADMMHRLSGTRQDLLTALNASEIKMDSIQVKIAPVEQASPQSGGGDLLSQGQPGESGMMGSFSQNDQSSFFQQPPGAYQTAVHGAHLGEGEAAEGAAPSTETHAQRSKYGINITA